MCGRWPERKRGALRLRESLAHLALLPQGQPERARRALAMARQMDAEGFGNCSNHYECEAVCPAEISVQWIAKFNREYVRAVIKERDS